MRGHGKTNAIHDFEAMPPRASALLDCMRAFGYNIQSAISDIVYKNISSGAKNLWLSFDRDGDSTSVSIVDDGTGIPESEFADAMRLGSLSPLAQRCSMDLERLGLGLETPGFPQCRNLIIATAGLWELACSIFRPGPSSCCRAGGEVGSASNRGAEAARVSHRPPANYPHVQENPTPESVTRPVTMESQAPTSRFSPRTVHQPGLITCKWYLTSQLLPQTLPHRRRMTSHD